MFRFPSDTISKNCRICLTRPCECFLGTSSLSLFAADLPLTCPGNPVLSLALVIPVRKTRLIHFFLVKFSTHIFLLTLFFLSFPRLVFLFAHPLPRPTFPKRELSHQLVDTVHFFMILQVTWSGTHFHHCSLNELKHNPRSIPVLCFSLSVSMPHSTSLISQNAHGINRTSSFVSSSVDTHDPLRYCVGHKSRIYISSYKTPFSTSHPSERRTLFPFIAPSSPYLTWSGTRTAASFSPLAAAAASTNRGARSLLKQTRASSSRLGLFVFSGEKWARACID